MKNFTKKSVIFFDYHERDATNWSEQKQYEKQMRYTHSIRKNNVFENELDEEVDNLIKVV